MMKNRLVWVIGAWVAIGILGACNSNNNDGKQQSAADTQAVMRSAPDTTTSNSYDAALALLDGIAVDRATFNQLYHNCRVESDEFNGKMLFDKTSPAGPNGNGIFAYVEETILSLRFEIRHQAPQKLGVKSAAFTIDGQTYTYDTEFNTDNVDGHTQEWSDEPVTTTQLPLLIKLATGKQASLQLSGAQGKATVVLTEQQQQAIKNMLMIYKGMLMGYNA